LKKIIIAAVSLNNVIGKDGNIPWHSKEDFKHFKNTTMGYPLIMGRKTFESLGKPLPGREHLVVTRNSNYKTEFEKVKIFSSLDEAISFTEKLNTEKIFIIGGGEIYKAAIKYADILIISRMKINVEGDTYFPPIKDDIWKITASDKFEDFEVITYSRI
jgi:dihydrofolate reductase